MNKETIIKSILSIAVSFLLYWLMKFICVQAGGFNALSYLMGAMSISIYGTIVEKIQKIRVN